MFKDILAHMQLSLEERKAHLVLEESCIEIGGSDSTQFKGLLAHFLQTTIPNNALLSGNKKIYLCHACNNHKCSNPKHLYWGSGKENSRDCIESGRWKGFRLEEKYGIEKAKELRRKAGRAGGIASKSRGIHNEGKTKIDLSIWKDALESTDLSKFGWQSMIAKKLGTTHTTVKRVTKKYFSHLFPG